MSLRILIIGFVWPEPNSSAAGSRMMQLIELFQNQNWEITFVSAAQQSDYSTDLKSLGIACHQIKLNDNGFDDFIKVLNPNVVVFDRFMTEEQYGWRVSEYCPEAIRLLDTEDLHSLRAARQTAIQEKRLLTELDYKGTIAKREISAILRCDLSLIISDYEMKWLQDIYNIDREILHYMPYFTHKIEENDAKMWLNFDERAGFVSIGNFLHPPNADAVKYLKEELWPLIRKRLPQASIHIYGAYMPEKYAQWNNEAEGFYMHGRADSAIDVLKKARVCLAPLRFGAGIKGKLVDSMLAGTPSVTTDIGKEGIAEDLPWNGLIANDAETFAEAAVELHQNKVLWQQSQQNGESIINQRLSDRTRFHVLVECIVNIQSNLNQHRLKNFMGALLMQNTTLAYKYLSRWIEDKNKHVD